MAIALTLFLVVPFFLCVALVPRIHRIIHIKKDILLNVLLFFYPVFALISLVLFFMLFH